MFQSFVFLEKIAQVLSLTLLPVSEGCFPQWDATFTPDQGLAGASFDTTQSQGALQMSKEKKIQGEKRSQVWSDISLKQGWIQNGYPELLSTVVVRNQSTPMKGRSFASEISSEFLTYVGPK